MSLQHFDSDNPPHGEPSADRETTRLLRYYLDLQPSLSMFTLVDNPMLRSIGTHAEAVLKAQNAKDLDELILVEPTDTHEISSPLVKFSPVTEWDEEDDIPYLDAQMTVDIGRLSDLEALGFSRLQISDLLTVELVRENYIAQAYLSGAVLEDGLQATVREAIKRQREYMQSSSGPSELRTLDEEHRQIIPTVFFEDDLEEAVRSYMGDDYFTDCTLIAFRNAAETRWNELNDGLNKSDSIEEEALRTIGDELRFLEGMFSDNPEYRQFAQRLYKLAYFSPDDRAEIYDCLVDQQSAALIRQEQNGKPSRRSQIQSHSPYQESRERRIKAVARMQRMATGTRMLFVADGLLEAAKAFYDSIPDEVEEE